MRQRQDADARREAEQHLPSVPRLGHTTTAPANGIRTPESRQPPLSTSKRPVGSPQVTKGQEKYHRSPATHSGMSTAAIQPFYGARRHRPTGRSVFFTAACQDFAAEPPSRRPDALQGNPHQRDIKLLREPSRPAKRAAVPKAPLHEKAAEFKTTNVTESQHPRDHSPRNCRPPAPCTTSRGNGT